MPGLLIIRFSPDLGLSGRASAYTCTILVLQHLTIIVLNYKTHAHSICLGPIALTELIFP